MLVTWRERGALSVTSVTRSANLSYSDEPETDLHAFRVAAGPLFLLLVFADEVMGVLSFSLSLSQSLVSGKNHAYQRCDDVLSNCIAQAVTLRKQSLMDPTSPTSLGLGISAAAAAAVVEALEAAWRSSLRGGCGHTEAVPNAAASRESGRAMPAYLLLRAVPDPEFRN